MDRPFVVTLFTGRGATSKQEQQFTLRTLANRVQTTTHTSKSVLPWLKLARFGQQKTDKGSLRHDANVLAISGVEADYDGEQIPFATAVDTLTRAGLLALIYTSPSHTTLKPRWRVLCPLSAEQPPDRRHHLLGRLNGLFRGVFSGESWTLSQSYYFGSVDQNLAHRVELIEGAFLDQMDDLDEIWVGKPNTGPTAGCGTEAGSPPRSGAVDEAALLEAIASGSSYHEAAVRLLGKWARNGMAFMDARARLIDAMEQVFPPDRDARWHDRRRDIDRCLEDIYGKEAAAHDRGERHQGARTRRGGQDDVTDEPWPAPVDFLGDGDLTGVPELLPGHVPEVIYQFAADTAARMGVDPVSVALAAIVTCTSVIDEAWRVQPKRLDHTWTEAARLWGAIVGDPSILKSPVIAACTRPVERLDAAARARYATAMRSHKKALADWKEAGSNPAEMPRAPVLERHMVEGTTVEALSEVLRDDEDAHQTAPAGRVLVRQDEMSEWLASFDRYRSGGRGGADRGADLRLYNGGRYVVDRINRGSFAVPNWSACILGGIQPGPIQQIAQEAADDGLLQRFLYCVPARQGHGEDRPPNAEALARYEALIPALAALHPALNRGAGNLAAVQTDSVPVVLHADAHTHREAIADLASAMSALPDTSARLRASLGKWPGVFARLALAFHLIEAADARAHNYMGDPLSVLSVKTALRTLEFMRDVLLPHLLRAEAVMFASAQTGHARWIAGYILSRGQDRVALRDVVQAYGPLRAPESRRELLDVMESLVTVGWLRPEPQLNPARPPAGWQVNPDVHSTFAVRAEQERVARARARTQVADCVARVRGKAA